jgi:serine protease
MCVTSRRRRASVERKELVVSRFRLLVGIAAVFAAFLATAQSASANVQPLPADGRLQYGTGTVADPGVLIGKPRVYVVFYGSQWGTSSVDRNGDLTFSNDPSGGAPYMQELFRGIGTGNERWSNTLGQYCAAPDVSLGDTSCPSTAARPLYPRGGAFAGAWYDGATAEPVGAQYPDLAASARRAAVHFGNTTPASNATAMYLVLSAKGADPDHYIEVGTSCAWHGFVTDATLGSFALLNVPYVMEVNNCGAGFVNPNKVLDAYSISASHEYAEAITNLDPGRGWYHPKPDGTVGNEIADDCSWIEPGTPGGNGDLATAHGTFAVTSLWSNTSGTCVLSAAPVHTKGSVRHATRTQYALLTVDMLKSGTRSAGMSVRRK